MRYASEVQEEMRRAAVHLYDKGPTVARYDRVRMWSVFANEYLRASERLRTGDVPTLLPWCQVSGHSVECAVKSFLCAVGAVVLNDHDLVKLLDTAQRKGLSVDEKDVARLVHLNHQYSCDLLTRSRYKSRYPTDQWEMIGGTLPDQVNLGRIVRDFCDQAAMINERRNRSER